MNLILKGYWSNNPISIDEVIQNPELVLRVPVGMVTMSADVDKAYVDEQDSLLGNEFATALQALDDKKANATAVTQALSTKADLIGVSQALALKADAIATSQALDTKADVNYVDTQDGLLQDQIDLKANAIAVNQFLSNKADLVGGVIPSYQLPSYVDDVLNFPNLASFPVVGEDGKIYIAEDVNKTYRWGGSSYVEIGVGGVALGETYSTAYRGDRGKIAYDHSQSQGNPHNTTTSNINEGTRLYFTDDRVRATSLTGLSTATGGVISATDTVLGSLGKLQNQITNSGSSSPVWVELSTVGRVASYITPYSIQVSRFQGMLWIRGTFSVNINIAGNSELFRITAQAYKPYSYNAAGSARLLQVVSAWNILSTATKQVGMIALGNITNPTQAATTDVTFEAKGAGLSTSDGTINIPPTIIGTLVN